MRLKTIKDWFIKNFGTIFSVLGFAATIYLGVWYVPAWLKESQSEKIKSAENEILQSVKELVYSDSTFAINELTSLVHAKEITLKDKFPLSLSDILTKAEESFMEDKFLPLTKRRGLIKKIEAIKQTLPKETTATADKQKAEDKGAWWTSFASIFVAIISVLLGLISTFIKYQTDKDKEEELKNEIEQVTVDISNNFRQYSFEFEKKILEVLKARTDISVDEPQAQDRGIDFIITSDNKKYFVEAKYLSRSKIGLNTFHRLASYLRDKSGEAWLIYNTDLTPLVTKEIDDFNKQNKDIKIKAIRATDIREFSDKLNELLPPQHHNKT